MQFRLVIAIFLLQSLVKEARHLFPVHLRLVMTNEGIAAGMVGLENELPRQ